MTTDFTRDPDTAFPEDGFKAALTEATGGAIDFSDVTALALGLLGDAIGANMMLVGFAYQKGMLPVSAEAIEQALQLNGVAVDFNIAAFTWGRRAAIEPALVAKQAGLSQTVEPFDLDTFIARRIDDLAAYQNAAYAERYKSGIERIRAAEAACAPGSTALTETAARALFKLMAYKDEYEVARLYTDGRFEKRLRQAFEDGGKVSFHLAPPLLAERNPVNGHLKKRAYGPWMLSAFKILASLKGLRGTAFDPFGRTEERKIERQLITEYETRLSDICANLNASNLTAATALAAYPLAIRGFGHVKEANVAKVTGQLPALISAFQDPGQVDQAAE
jgi:indolepyruvate ferredoxin oxidoreductase